MSDDGDCCYPIRDTRAMTDRQKTSDEWVEMVKQRATTDHAQAKKLVDELERIDRVFRLPYDRKVEVIQMALTQAHATGRREAFDDIQECIAQCEAMEAGQ